jgi:aryl sulfotransferase
MDLPRVTRIYQNHHLDSKRWDPYQPRDGDVIVTTSYKSGTTFTQDILLHLLHGQRDPLPDRSLISPWPDARFHPVKLGDLWAWIESQRGTRFIKSHLPLDGLPWHEQARYLVVARDPRDVFMSFSNHYRNYTERAYESLDGPTLDGEARMGDALPRFDDDVHRRFRNWITRGWFEWESEGWPFWGNMHHTRTYWDFRHLPNLCFLHFADMLADLDGSVRKIADFIGLEVSDEDVKRVVEATRFESAKQRAIEADAAADPNEPRIFTGGSAAFIYKGTNGRWKDVLDAEDLALYEQTRDRVLSPDCARWLENGGDVA